MAVLQISKIQIRRGTAGGGTGIPQLASGELAWALDTQELYIGNGSVAEGSPAVGNTKVITENDFTTSGNILNLINHIYRVADTSIQTGPTANSPVSRLLQDRLDDRVTVEDFGAVGDGIVDDTAAIQRAINQLFLNPTTKASDQTNAAVSNRRVLEFGAGTYKITSTIYVPSYASLIGTGPEKTILRLDGTNGPLMQFVNDNSTIGNPSSLANTTGTTQPKEIRVQDMTLYVNSNTETALRLDAAYNCDIFDVNFQGSWDNDYNNSGIAIELNALSSLVTCEKNHFNHIDVSNFSHAVVGFGDLKANSFADFHIDDVYRGIALGYNISTGLYADGLSVGQEYGPRDSTFNNLKITNVKKQAVLVGLGTGNNFSSVILTNVGNDGYGNVSPLYPQIYFGSGNNNTSDIKSDRSDDLAFLNLGGFVTMATNTTTGSNLITVDSVDGLTYNLPIRFVGSNFGGIVVNTSYWIKDILSTDNIAISNVARDVGDVVTVNTASLHNLITNQTVTISNTGLVDEVDVLITVVDSNTFTFTSSTSGVVPVTSATAGLVIPDPQITITDTSLGSTLTLSTATGSSTIVTNWNIVPFIPILAGYAYNQSWGQYRFNVNDFTGSWNTILRLPLNCNELGIPERAVHYNLEYLYTTLTNYFVRAGDITITADADSANISMSDSYDYAGPLEDPSEPAVDPVALQFKAEIYDFDGVPYISTPQVPYSLVISYKNTLLNGQGQIAFSFTQILR